MPNADRIGSDRIARIEREYQIRTCKANDDWQILANPANTAGELILIAMPGWLAVWRRLRRIT